MSSRDNLLSCITDTPAEIFAKHKATFGKLSREIVRTMRRCPDENRAEVADACVLAQQISSGAIEGGINLREEFLLSVPDFNADTDMVFTNIRRLGKLVTFSNPKSMMLRLLWEVICDNNHDIRYKYQQAAVAIIKLKGDSSRLFELVRSNAGVFSVEEISLDDIEDECLKAVGGDGVIYQNYHSLRNS